MAHRRLSSRECRVCATRVGGAGRCASRCRTTVKVAHALTVCALHQRQGVAAAPAAAWLLPPPLPQAHRPGCGGVHHPGAARGRGRVSTQPHQLTAHAAAAAAAAAVAVGWWCCTSACWRWQLVDHQWWCTVTCRAGVRKQSGWQARSDCAGAATASARLGRCMGHTCNHTHCGGVCDTHNCTHISVVLLLLLPLHALPTLLPAIRVLHARRPQTHDAVRHRGQGGAPLRVCLRGGS
jgi:hypothetical protein